MLDSEVNGLWSARTSQGIESMLSDIGYLDRDVGHANPEGVPPPVPAGCAFAFSLRTANALKTFLTDQGFPPHPEVGLFGMWSIVSLVCWARRQTQA